MGKRSNLSITLSEAIEDLILVSKGENFEKFIKNLILKNKSIKTVFNNFQASNKLYDINNLDEYTKNSIYYTSKILTILNNNKIKIDKIIYTSNSYVIRYLLVKLKVYTPKSMRNNGK